MLLSFNLSAHLHHAYNRLFICIIEVSKMIIESNYSLIVYGHKDTLIFVITKIVIYLCRNN